MTNRNNHFSKGEQDALDDDLNGWFAPGPAVKQAGVSYGGRHVAKPNVCKGGGLHVKKI